MVELSKISVLVVDDSEEYNEVLRDSLMSECGKVFSAYNGKEALEILRAYEINLVISDVQMPVMDGPSLVKNLRASDPYVPIILLATGQSQLSETEAFAIGSNGLIHKPFKISDLLVMIKQLFNDQRTNMDRVS